MQASHTEGMPAGDCGSGGGLRGVLCGGPAMGKEVGQGLARSGRESGEHVSEIHERVNAVASAGLGHGVVNRRRHAALVAPGEEPVLAAECRRPQRSLGGVVVDVEPINSE
jgi:hypothetical protein